MQTAWVIKDVQGVFFLWTCAETHDDAVDRFDDAKPYEWEHYRNRGYSCVKVTIKEVEE